MNAVNTPNQTSVPLSLCVSVTHRSIHHVGFAVPQSLHSVENIHHTLSLSHLAHDAAGTENSAAPTSISVDTKTETQRCVTKSTI